MLTRAYWYKTGMADSAQLREGSSGHALPTHHHTSKRGPESQHRNIKTKLPGLGVLPLDLVHRGVAGPGSPLRKELSSLGYAGDRLPADPHT